MAIAKTAYCLRLQATAAYRQRCLSLCVIASEAKLSSLGTVKNWIASSQTLLAMTIFQFVGSGT
jgi:hypothetical protein